MKKKILILSDAHADLESLSAVLKLAGGIKNYDMKIFLGDAIGYGDKPNEVLEILTDFDILIQGNHELLAIGEADELSYSRNARETIKRHMEQIGSKGISFLKTFKESYSYENILFFHGAPTIPMEYLFNDSNIIQIFHEYPDHRLFFGGHLHIPRLAVKKSNDDEIIFPELSIPRSSHSLDLKRYQYLVNCPSATPGRFQIKNPGCCTLTFNSKKSITLELLFVE
ncbi:MAG: metallophosphoesterase [Candidatus Zixiibacteriota bacterium]